MAVKKSEIKMKCQLIPHILHVFWKKIKKKTGALSCKLCLPVSEFLIGLRTYKGYVLVSSESYSTPQDLARISEYYGCHTLPESYFYFFSDTKLSL